MSLDLLCRSHELELRQLVRYAVQVHLDMRLCDPYLFIAKEVAVPLRAPYPFAQAQLFKVFCWDCRLIEAMLSCYRVKHPVHPGTMLGRFFDPVGDILWYPKFLGKLPVHMLAKRVLPVLYVQPHVC